MDRNSKVLAIVFLVTVILAIACSYVRTIYYHNFEVIESEVK